MLTRRQLLERPRAVDLGCWDLLACCIRRGCSNRRWPTRALARMTWAEALAKPDGEAARAFSGQGEARHLALHERRAEPCRHLGLQAGAGKARRQIDQGIRPGLQEHHGLLHGRGRRADEVAVPVQPAGRVRQAGLGDLPESGRARRQDGVHPLGLHRVEQPLAGAFHDEHRHAADGISVRRLVGDLRPGERDAEPSGLRGDVRPAGARAAQRQRGNWGAAFLPGVFRDASAPQGRADRQPRRASRR